MNRLFLIFLAVVFSLTVPSAAAAADEPIPGGPDEAAPYCGQDVVCPPPTRTCDIGTNEDPAPAQEYCIWPEDPPVQCDGYPEWQDDPVSNENQGEEGVEPGYPGDGYSDGSEPGFEDVGNVDPPGYPGYEADDGDWTDPGDGAYCAYDLLAGGPKTWKHPRSTKAERVRARRRAAKRRAIRAKRARIQTRRAKARQAADRRQAQSRRTLLR